MKTKIGFFILLLAHNVFATNKRKRCEDLTTLRSLFAAELDDEIIVWYYEMNYPNLDKTINALWEITNEKYEQTLNDTSKDEKRNESALSFLKQNYKVIDDNIVENPNEPQECNTDVDLVSGGLEIYNKEKHTKPFSTEKNETGNEYDQNDEQADYVEALKVAREDEEEQEQQMNNHFNSSDYDANVESDGNYDVKQGVKLPADFENYSNVMSNVPNDIKMLIVSFSTLKERFNMHLTRKCWQPVFNYRNLLQMNTDKTTVLQEKTTGRLLLVSGVELTELKQAVESEIWENVFDNLNFYQLRTVPNFKTEFTKLVFNKLYSNGKIKEMQPDTYEYIYSILTNIIVELKNLDGHELEFVREYALGSCKGLENMDFSFQIGYAASALGDSISKWLLAVELGDGRNMNRQINQRGDTLFTLAICTDDAELVKLFLDNGADINKRDRFENTPLMIAVYKGMLRSVKILLVRGADIHAKNEDDDKNTAIDIAEERCQRFQDTDRVHVYKEILDTLNLYKQNL